MSNVLTDSEIAEIQDWREVGIDYNHDPEIDEILKQCSGGNYYGKDVSYD